MMRRLLALGGALTLTVMLAGVACAQYPVKPLRFVVPFPPGGSADLLARALAQTAAAQLGQPVIVENKAGAGTAIAARDVASAAPDGYTIMLGTVSSHVLTPLLNPGAGYDPIRGFDAIAPLASIPFAMLVHPSVPAKSVQEFIALAKSRPGKLTYASAGVGTSNHLAGELLKSATGIDLLHVPYKGSAPALTDLLGGRVEMMFDLLLTATKHVSAGTVRALAVTSKTRSPLLPQIPTFAEAGIPQLTVSAWFGVFAPAGTPSHVVERLNAELRKAMRTTDVMQRLEAMGADALEGNPQQFSEYVRGEYETWKKVIERAAIRVEAN